MTLAVLGTPNLLVDFGTGVLNHAGAPELEVLPFHPQKVATEPTPSTVRNPPARAGETALSPTRQGGNSHASPILCKKRSFLHRWIEGPGQAVGALDLSSRYRAGLR